MLKIENETIHLTRGDIALFGITTKQEDGTDYEFKTGDIVRLKVFKCKDCNCVEIQKDTKIEEPTTEAQINLTSEDTKIGDIINKPVKYWYEVELNPDTEPQTIIGYDDKGAKEFILYPEGSDKQ